MPCPYTQFHTSHYFLLIAILLVGVWLRVDALTQDVRFHPDEALFATFARDAAVHGQWMFPGALDKPPLSLYAAALSMHSVGSYPNDKGVLDLDLRVGEFAARLPSTFTGMIAIALVYALTVRLTCQRDAALIAALLMALSPFHVAFSATAFTDPLMLTCGLASLFMAARGRPAWAGVWLALSVWSKQQGVFLLPLVVWIIFFRGHVGMRYSASAGFKPWPLKQTPHWASLQMTSIVVLLATFAVGVGLLVVWDAARASSQQATSLFALAAVNNNPERTFIRLDEVLQRLAVWGNYLGTFFGAPLVTFGLIFVGLIGIPRRMWRVLAPLAGYCTLYLLAHWLVAFNLYDRYLLPLVPLTTVIVGTGVASVLSGVAARRTGRALSLQIMLVGVLGGLILLSAFPFHYPTDDRARDDDIIELAAQLNAKSLGAILYDPWLGWELGYYLGAWSDKRRVYYPAPEILADDALLNPDLAPRYFIAPYDRDTGPWITALEARDFSVSLDWENDRYVVFKLLPPATVADS